MDKGRRTRLENIIDKIKKVKPATYIRTASLIIALANQACHQLGLIPLPAQTQDVYGDMSLLLTALTGLTAWWKNNSFTGAAIKADELLNELREND